MAPVSVRFNNPGAINVASWVMALPGYTGAKETTPGNHTASFSTPEHGVAAYWELLRRYRDRGITTVSGIVTQYGGGQDYSAYLKFVVNHGDLRAAQTIDLDDDTVLLRLARAQFQYEAGAPIKLTNSQIAKGFRMARAAHGGAQGSLWSLLLGLFKRK